MAYSQNDLNWKNAPLGFDSGDSSNPNYGTIGMYGCYVTSIANVCKWAGNDQTPAQINQLCKDNGWFVKGDLIARDDIPSLLCSNLQFSGKTTWNDVTSMNFFADASDPNVAYIICIDASKSPGIQTHFVMVWATLGASDLEIEDSWDGVRKPLSHYGNPGVIIQSATKFVKVTPAPAPQPEPVVVPEPAPVPEPPTPPAPYVPPAAPVPLVKAEKYEILTTLPVYTSADEVARAKNPVDIIQPGFYFVWDKQGTNGNYWSLSTLNTKDEGMWINIIDNKKPLNVPKPAPVTVTLQVAPEKPAPRAETESDIRASWKWFYPDHEPVEYLIDKDYTVRNILQPSPPISIHKGKTIEIYGTFISNGQLYLRPLTGMDEKAMHQMYGIPTTDVYSGAPYLNNLYSVKDKVYYGVDLFIDKSIKTLEGIFRWIKKK